ncbi:MAG TPA: GAF domain-containing protein [Candidatus Marinimicrobia bacterium]|nr:GAF domain-containing protein [Candidatus Neomarinimicrobiota bacterium]
MNDYDTLTKAELITEIQKLRQALSAKIADTADLTLINKIGGAVIQKEPIADIFMTLSRQFTKIFNTHGIGVYLLANDGTHLVMQASTIPAKTIQSVKNILGLKIPEVVIPETPESLYFATLRSGKPAILNESDNISRLIGEFITNKRYKKFIPAIQKVLEIKHVVIFPLISSDTALGILDISRKSAFTNQEIERIHNITLQVTEAILYHKAVLEKESLLRELQEAYNKLKKLSGLIPICSHCKKIRDDNGFWNQVEQYISEHTDAVFSHGICPDCMKKLYPDYLLNPKERKKP